VISLGRFVFGPAMDTLISTGIVAFGFGVVMTLLVQHMMKK